MKKRISSLLVVVAIASITYQVSAQNAMDTRSKSNLSNNKTAVENSSVCVGTIRCADGTCSISFEQEVVSPRDMASGLPTGKRQHKPFVITKEYDKSSPVLAKGSGGAGAGKVSMSDFSITVMVRGSSRKLPVVNNQFTLPNDCPNGDVSLIASWSWGASNSGSSRCEVPFTLSFADGEYHAINTKGTGVSR